MTDALFISLWAYLFTGVLSEPGAVFGWLNKGLCETCPEWLYKPLIGCAVCHAGQVALWFQVWAYFGGGGFSVPFILISIGSALLLVKLDLAFETWQNR